MHFVAGLICAWAILYFVVAVYFLRRYFVDGRQFLYLDLVALSAGLAAYSLLSARLTLATDPDLGGLLVRIGAALSLVVVAHLFDFTMRFAGLDGRRYRRLAQAVFAASAVGAAVVAAGLAYDPARPFIHEVHAFGIDGVYYEHAATPLGGVVLIWILGISVASAAITGRAAMRDRVNALPVFLGTALFVATVINDVLVNAGWLPSLYLGEHGYLLLLCGFGYAQLGRSTRLASELQARSRELESAHRELEEVYRSLRQSYDSLSRTQDELQAAGRLADLGRMAASLAHEIRNPLCVLTNVAAGLRRHAAADAAHPDERALIEALSEEVSRLDRLVDDLLAFARPDRRSRTRASLAMIADHAILAVVSALPDPGRYEFKREYPDPPPKAMIEIDRLRRALVNLVLNACQAMPEGGPITVLVAPGERDGSVRVGIRDAGEGIAPENLPRIFTPFFSTKPAGTGLGLSIVRAIAEDHEGRVDVETAAGKGTTFWLQLYCENTRPEPSVPRRSVAP
jgi:signal transduction histidine kinase